MDRFMELAVREAKKGVSKGEGGPFGAVVVCKGKVIAKAHNTVVTGNDPTRHAEMNAIRKASSRLRRFDLSDCEIYTTCEPCPMCLGAIEWARIKKVHYGCTEKDAASIGFDDKKFHKSGRKGVNMRQVSRKECLAVFSEWSKKKDKVRY
ncbi:nucleoside deaminase [Candidatus Woesearchaeota archaeon]|nr:nucleoside deaminase [Candidatus Woesearchaeota archaeon]